MTRDDYMEIVTPLIKEAWSDGKAGKYRDVWESWATANADTIQKAIGHVPSVNAVELIHMIGRDCLEAWDRAAMERKKIV